MLRTFTRNLIDLMATALLAGGVMFAVGYVFSFFPQDGFTFIGVMRPIEEWSGSKGFLGVTFYGLFVTVAYLSVRKALGEIPNYHGRIFGVAFGFGLFLLVVLVLCFELFFFAPMAWGFGPSIDTTGVALLLAQCFSQFVAAGFLVGSLIDGVTIRVSTNLPVSADRAWELLLRTDTFLFITRGMMSFKENEDWPEVLLQQGKTHTMRMRPLNLPPWTYQVVTVERVDAEARQVETREQGGIVRAWLHQMSIEPVSENECRYSDRIALFAGWLTLGVALFAAVFYRFRQRRWQLFVQTEPKR